MAGSYFGVTFKLDATHKVADGRIYREEFFDTG